MRTVALYEMLFGILAIAGGAIDYTSAGNIYMLVAGLLAGMILVLAALKMQKGAKSGVYTCLIVTVLLLAYSARDFFFLPNGRFMPTGLISVLAIISLLLLVVLLLQPTERKRIF